MKILIVEPDLGGHHLNYLKLTIEAFNEAGHRCLLLTHSDSQTLFEKHRAELQVADVFYLPQPSRVLKKMKQTGWWFFRQLSLLLQLRGGIRDVLENQSFDKIWFSSLDDLIHAWGALGSPASKTCSCSGLFLHQFIGLEECGVNVGGRFKRVKKFLFLRFLSDRKIRSACTILPPVITHVQKYNKLLGGKLHFAPDPICVPERMSREKALKTLSLRDADCILMIYGALSARKGIYNLLAALKSARWPETASVVCAGQLAEEVKDYVDKNFQNELLSGKLQLVNRFLGNTEEAAIYSTADIMWVGYENFYGNSGVLLQSIACSIPVIGNCDGMVGVFLQEHQECGYMIDTSEPGAVIGCISSFLNEKITVPEIIANQVLLEGQEDSFKNAALRTLGI